MKKKSNFYSLVILILFMIVGTTSSLSAQITGSVFRDYNGNGIQDANEPFMPGVTVNAYNAANVLCGSALTVGGSTAPNYTLTGCGTAAVRVEFVLPSSSPFVVAGVDFPSLSGVTYGTSVQFVNGNSSNVNFALHDPDDFNTGTANVSNYIPCYVNGDPLPVGSPSGAMDWFVGYPNTHRDFDVLPQKVGGSVIGATWGVAYSKYANRVFTSAFIKRHVGLGTLGSGGIYMLEPTATSFNITAFYDMDANGHRTRAAAGAVAYGDGSSFQLNAPDYDEIIYLGAIDPISGFPEGLGVVGANGTGGRDLPTNTSSPSYDPAAFDQVGKVGLGGLEISDDGKFLFVMNLYSRSVFRLELDDIYNPTSVINVTEIPIPVITCNDGELRPFALTYNRGKLYAGAVCSAEYETSNNSAARDKLFAYVFEMDNPNTGTTFTASPIISQSLNYSKGYARFGPTSDTYGQYWSPWSNRRADFYSVFGGTVTVKPIPVLSDITFGNNGQIILDFFDRTGHQYGDDNRGYLSTRTTLVSANVGGEILTAGLNASTGNYQMELDGAFTSNNVSFTSVGNGDPDFFNFWGGIGNRRSFFTGDYQNSSLGHAETALGSSAYLPGQSKVHFTVYNPIATWSNGTRLMSMSDGSYFSNDNREYYQIFIGGQDPATFGKANGLGELEFTVFEAPIEIGNRVWSDVADGDGIQDVGEPGISGIEVQLWKEDAMNPGTFTQIATVTTDANGEYFFSSASGTSTTGITYNVSMLQPNMNYELRFPTTTTLSGDLLTITLADMGGADANADVRDSDASTAGVVSFMTAGVGSNSHSYDVGYRMQTSVALGNFVFMDNNGDGIFNTGNTGFDDDMPIQGVLIELFESGDDPQSATPVGMTTTNVSGYYYFDNLAPGDYFVYIQEENFQMNGALEDKLSSTGSSDPDTNTTDDDDNGIDDATPEVNGISSPVVTLSLGGEPTDESGQGGDDGTYPGTLPDENVNETVDFSFETEKVALGNFVFMDTNEDGDYDDGTDMPIQGVLIELFESGDDPQSATPVGMTTTNASGYYYFDNLEPGDYFVYIQEENFQMNGALEDKLSSTGSSDPDTNTTDDDDNGIDDNTPETNGISSPVVTLSPGDEPTDEPGQGGDDGTYPGTLPDENVNETVDFSFETEKVALGNFVFMDTNEDGDYDDGTDMPIQGVLMELFVLGDDPQSATPVGMTTTNASGYYYFDNLEPGNYFVYIQEENFQMNGALEDKLSSTGSSDPNTNTTDDDDNGIDDNTPETNGIRSQVVILSPGDEPTDEPGQGGDDGTYPGTLPDENVNETVDFSFEAQIFDLALIIEDASTPSNGMFYQANEAITFKITVQNQGELPASDIVVTNYVPDEFLGEPTAMNIMTMAIGGGATSSGTPSITRSDNSTDAQNDDFTIDFGNTESDWLQPGDLLMFAVIYNLSPSAVQGQEISIFSEISANDNDNNAGDTPPTDADSTPDDTNGNGNGESTNLKDDVLNEDGTMTGQDEDDHDIERIPSDLVLPVELLGFKATANKTHIDLTWSTASELNNSHFEVERSEDGKTFKQITRIQGKGTTLEQTDYSYEDREAIPNVLYYYRLKQVDTDGQSEYSEVRTTQLEMVETKMELYPNPIGDATELQVRFYTTELTKEFIILDIHNRTVLQVKQDLKSTGWNGISIDIQVLPAGTYILIDKKGNSKRFVKTKE